MPRNVADRINAARARVLKLIDDDVPGRARGDAGMLEAELDAIDRDTVVDVAATVAAAVASPTPASASPAPMSPVPAVPAGSAAALESAAP